MMKKLILIFIFCMNLGAMLAKDASIVNILAKTPYFVSESNCDRVYISPEKIYPTQEGLFIELSNNEYAAIPCLLADSQGCYIPIDSDRNLYLSDNLPSECGSRVTDKPKKWQCPYCHHWWELGEKCQNDDCPTNRWEK